MENSKYCFDEKRERALFPSKLNSILETEEDVEKLREYLGVSIQAINQYRHGVSYPKMENLIKIAECFGTSVDYFLGFTDVPNRDSSIQSVNIATGLSPDAICFLHDLHEEAKKNIGGAADLKLRTIDRLLDGSRQEVNDFWERIMLFVFSEGGDFNFMLPKGEALIPRDVALRALLEMNNDFLFKEKRRILEEGE